MSFREYFRGAVDTHDTYLGNTIISASSGHQLVVIAVPLYSPKNQSLIGVWAGGVEFNAVNKELQSLGLDSKNERIIYLDGNGTKIAYSNQKLSTDISESFNGLKSFRNGINGNSGSLTEEVNQTRMLVSYYPVKALQNTWVVLWMRTTI